MFAEKYLKIKILFSLTFELSTDGTFSPVTNTTGSRCHTKGL